MRRGPRTPPRRWRQYLFAKGRQIRGLGGTTRVARGRGLLRDLGSQPPASLTEVLDELMPLHFELPHRHVQRVHLRVGTAQILSARARQLGPHATQVLCGRHRHRQQQGEAEAPLAGRLPMARGSHGSRVTYAA